MSQNKTLLRLLFLTTIISLAVGMAESSDPNSIIRDAINQGVGGGVIPKGTDFKVKDWQGGSSSHSFPGGSVSGTTYTGTLRGGAGEVKCHSVIILLSSFVVFFLTKI